MSRRTDNRHRVATICREATGLPHHVCMRWAADGLISRGQPVPDAESAAQRAFEAQIVTELAQELRHRPREGALFGFVSGVPTRGGLLLDIHPAMADEVLAAVLPRIDEHYGGLRGVPGLRLTPLGDSWALMRVGGAALVRLRPPRADWQPSLPEHGDGLTQLWRRSRHRQHPAESSAMSAWSCRGSVGEAHALDWLNSRLLRRPCLLNTVVATHGSADTYTHGSMDLVVEWCCALRAAELERRLRQSGLAHRPAGVAAHSRDTPWFPGEIGMGGAFVSLRSGTCRGR
ncbi:hypothetical protein ACIBEA_28225 [Streptomyces sp. NPDC051555]|uniref:hypothetical protein n=1 Tax=Streptomyces sp. NPDC051555 TaxID=3365657 RepID=UPI00379349CC